MRFLDVLKHPDPLWLWGLPGSVHGANGFDVIGPKGAIVFQYDIQHIMDTAYKLGKSGEPFELNRFKNPPFTLATEKGKEYIDFSCENTDPCRGKPTGGEIAHFVECVKENKTPLVTIENGIESLRIGMAILKAAETGKVVKVAEIK